MQSPVQTLMACIVLSCLWSNRTNRTTTTTTTTVYQETNPNLFPILIITSIHFRRSTRGTQIYVVKWHDARKNLPPSFRILLPLPNALPQIKALHSSFQLNSISRLKWSVLTDKLSKSMAQVISTWRMETLTRRKILPRRRNRTSIRKQNHLSSTSHMWHAEPSTHPEYSSLEELTIEWRDRDCLVVCCSSVVSVASRHRHLLRPGCAFPIHTLHSNDTESVACCSSGQL